MGQVCRNLSKYDYFYKINKLTSSDLFVSENFIGFFKKKKKNSLRTSARERFKCPAECNNYVITISVADP